MNWQQIMEKALEINELQQEIYIKLLDPIIQEITARNIKYCDNEDFNLKSLNNAILEHKIEITPYQIIILKKINDLELDTSNQSIYINMPDTETEAEKYVTQLKKKYELANKCLDLVMNIERLSEIEYETTTEFKNTEYAKKTKIENEIFKKVLFEFANLPPEIFKNLLIKNYKEYMNTLSIDNKRLLFIEILSLSYDRNSFEYFNKEKLIMKIGNEKKYNIQQIFSLDRTYSKYKKILIVAKKIILTEMSLQEIYDELKIIYETELFKQKIMKK